MTVLEKSFNLLQDCQENQTSVYFSGDGLDIVFQTTVLNINRQFVVIANPVAPEYISAVVKSRNFGLQCKMSRFTSNKINTDGENIVFPLEELKEIAETRQAERFPFDTEERVICQLLNPFDQETILSKVVLDMSATGLSLRSPRPSKLFRPGVTFPEVRVLIDGEPYTKAAATVVYTRKMIDRNGKLRVQVGFKFS